MKLIKNVFAILMVILVSSCDKTGTDSSIKRMLVGRWVVEDLEFDDKEDWEQDIESYVEFTKDGFFKGYALPNEGVKCFFENGVLHAPSSGINDYITQYVIKDGRMVGLEGIFGSKDLNIINKDEIHFIDPYYSEVLYIIHRIKKIQSIEKSSQE